MADVRCLLDTGPLVALLHAGDAQHASCAGFIEGFSGQLLTTEPVLTEAMALLADVHGGPSVVLDFFLRGGAVLVPQSPRSLRRARELIEKYGDLPMDFADATLVALAEEVPTPDIFTLDRRGFRVYRWSGRNAFRIHPG
ncbi:MAG: PIN domain-containing protein [Planctomycetes bacterium]|nr:PIN domain-containing protein [Planctomycetota bacterium]